MQVRVFYFGVLKDLLNRDKEQLELPPSASVGTLLEVVRGEVPESGAIWKSLAVAVNCEYAEADLALKDGDEVALLPPVSGGVEDAVPWTSLRSAPDDTSPTLGRDGRAR